MKLETHKDLFKHRDYALSFPGAFEDFPHGHSVIKVGSKIFAFLGQDEEGRPNIAVKLPVTCHHILSRKIGEPTGYGLGKYGWVTIRVDKKDAEREKIIRDGIVESYRSIAPKKLIAELDGVEKKGVRGQGAGVRGEGRKQSGR